MSGGASSGARDALRIAILGDRVDGYAKHAEIAPALERAAAAAGLAVAPEWVSSPRLAGDGALRGFAGAFAAPQSEAYCRNPAAVIAALRHARESRLPCLAVCGGAELALRETADETGDTALAEAVMGPVACDVPSPDAPYAVTGHRRVRTVPGTRTAAAYGRREVTERFECNRSLDSAAERALRKAGVRRAGTTPGLGATILEWADSSFHVATLFLPHWSPGPHPLLVAFLRTAADRDPTGLRRRA